jgi:hypothetical protein
MGMRKWAHIGRSPLTRGIIGPEAESGGNCFFRGPRADPQGQVGSSLEFVAVLRNYVADAARAHRLT